MRAPNAAKEAAATPFFAGPIHGVRAWSIEWRQGDGYLRGWVQAESWTPGGEATEAGCRTTRHQAPQSDCACGLYAYHPHAYGKLTWPSSTDGEPLVVGVVEAWGTVEVHRDGFRAEYARPVLLARAGARRGSDRDLRLTRIAERYGADLVDADSPRDLARLCAERGYGLSPATVGELVGTECPSEDSGTVSHQTSGRRTGRVDWWLDTVILPILGLAWWAFLALIAIRIGVAVISGLGDDPKSPFRGGHLEIVDEAITNTSGRPTYIAVVRNTSEKSTALAVFARGRVATPGGEVAARIAPRSRAYNRPTLLPGERGTVVVPLADVDRKLLRRAKPKAEVVARRDPAPPHGLGLRIGRARLDPASCRIVAPVRLDGNRRRTELEVVLRDRRDRIVAAEPASVGRLKGPRDRIVLTPKRRSFCRPNWAQAEVYPHVLPEDVPVAPGAR